MSYKHLGLGVMINMLGGDEDTVKAFRAALGKTITGLTLKDNALHFRFSDGSGIRVYDDGQRCCEHRYMHTDDDLSVHNGGTLGRIELQGAPDVKSEGKLHEVQFLVLTTSKGQSTVETHNEHNGYYGGFWIVVKPMADEGPNAD